MFLLLLPRTLQVLNLYVKGNWSIFWSKVLEGKIHPLRLFIAVPAVIKERTLKLIQPQNVAALVF